MRTRRSHARWSAPLLVATLAVSIAGLTAAPASAATSTFDQTDDIFVGDGNAVGVTNAAAITIPDSGPAAPYPSQINVTAAASTPAFGGEITDVNVTLFGVSHTFPDDIDVLLVGPGGQRVVLMSDAGGNNDLAGVNLTFSDGSPALPDATAIASGAYSPTNYIVGDVFPAPAPSNATSAGSSLASFNGTSPIGVWKLFVVDDTGGDNGSIANGWSLAITTATSPYPSTISVSGVGIVSDVNVTLHGVTGPYPDDSDFLLVGPGGQATIMSDAGGGSGPNALNNVDITLDDEAAAPLPDEAPITSGSYQPANYLGVDPFPAPAPVATGQSNLSVFDGASGNGEWRLFVVDDFAAFRMTLSGWSLEITWADTQAPTGSVTINAGAATTSSPQATLTLSANDPSPASGVKQMRFSNDGVTFSPYQPFATTAPWTLASGDGTKTVYAQFKDGDGNESAVVSDTITLKLPDKTGPKAKKTSPKNGAKGVKTSTKVTIKASEALSKKSVSGTTVFLKAKGSSKKIEAKVKYKNKTITLTPKSALKKGTKYTVTVKGVKDVNGNKWDQKPGKSGAQKLTFSFTTA